MAERQCANPECGKMFRFRSKHPLIRHCSRKCSSVAVVSERACANPRCGNTFMARRNQKYCSDGCLDTVAPRMIERACEQCGGTFKVDSGDVPRKKGAGRFCSWDCRRAFYPSVTLTCPVCGGTFERKKTTHEQNIRRRPNRPTYCSASCRSSVRAPRTADDFWARVDRSGGPDACWPWMRGRSGRSGRFDYGATAWQGRTRGSHVVAYEISYGPLPEGCLVCHSCDNPPCCNPAHLFPGTVATNADDMVRKGRANTPRGEQNGQAKLTEDQVREIRQRLAWGWRQQQLASLYGVGIMAISDIKRRRSWKHVA